MFFPKFGNNIILISWFDCEQHGKYQYEKKEHNRRTSVFKA